LLSVLPILNRSTNCAFERVNKNEKEIGMGCLL